MTAALDAPAVLDREFLEIRARLLHLASALDRIDRADGSLDGDARAAKILQALAVLADGSGDRAEKIQLLFSRPYDANWKSNLLADKT